MREEKAIGGNIRPGQGSKRKEGRISFHIFSYHRKKIRSAAKRTFHSGLRDAFIQRNGHRRMEINQPRERKVC
jgi:hypothetical protein